MAEKFLEHDGAGAARENEGLIISAGVGDAGKIIALDAAGLIDQTMMPVGIGADIALLATSEDLSAGDFVNVYYLLDVATVRKADATVTGKEVTGFVLAATISPANAIVYSGGINTQLTILATNVGKMHFLDTTAGGITVTSPSGTGNIVQKIGRSVGTNAISFDATNPIELA